MKHTEYKKLLKEVVDGKEKAINKAFSVFYGKCPYCGKKFQKTRDDQIYDKNSCRVLDSKKRKKEK